jgi:hypothetical protein
MHESSAAPLPLDLHARSDYLLFLDAYSCSCDVRAKLRVTGSPAGMTVKRQDIARRVHARLNAKRCI